jgi:hypothetical protein
MALRFLPVSLHYDQFTRAVHVAALQGDTTIDVQISRAVIEHLAGVTLPNKDDSFTAVSRYKEILESAADTALADRGGDGASIAIKIADLNPAESRIPALHR